MATKSHRSTLGCLGILFALCTAGALQTTSSVSSQSANMPAITGAQVEAITLDQSTHHATIRIRNLSDKPITAFDLVICTAPKGKQPEVSDFSYRLRDLLGIRPGLTHEIQPGGSFEEVIYVDSVNVTIDLDLVVFNDASAEFTNREMLMQVMAERKAEMDAENKTKEIIRNSSSKEEAVDKLTRAWEESKETAPLQTHALENHLYNLKHQQPDSAADEKRQILDYADQTEKDAQFMALHVNLHRRAQ